MINTLEADGIILNYGLRTILSGIYIKSETGKITALVGNNGSGKSSLMKVMFGVLEPESKSIRINNTHTPCAFKRGDAINYLPQKSFLPTELTTGQVFYDYKSDINHFASIFHISINRKDKIYNIHNSTRRLIEIYVLVMSDTKFTLLDEPFVQLSPILIEQAHSFLLQQKKRKGIVITDHNFNSLKNIADNLFLLNNGRLKYFEKIDPDHTYLDLFE